MPDGTKNSANNNGSNNNGNNRSRGPYNKSRDVVITCNKPISAGWLVFITTLLTLTVNWFLFPMIGIEETYYVKGWVAIALIVFLLNQFLVNGCKAATWYDANPRQTWTWWPTSAPGYILLILLLVLGISAIGYLVYNYDLSDMLPKQETADNEKSLVDRAVDAISSVIKPEGYVPPEGLSGTVCGENGEPCTGADLKDSGPLATKCHANGYWTRECQALQAANAYWENVVEDHKASRFNIAFYKQRGALSTSTACWDCGNLYTGKGKFPVNCNPGMWKETGNHPKTGIRQDKASCQVRPTIFP